jgi:ABC-2 type transport system permease protein
MTRKALRVARWEFVERVKTKSFLIGLFITPAIMAVFALAPALLHETLTQSSVQQISVYDGTGVVVDSLSLSLQQSPLLPDGTPKYSIQAVEEADRPLSVIKADLDSALLREHIRAAIIIPPEAIDSHRIEFRALNVSDIETVTRLERRISDILSEFKLLRAGLDPAQVDALTRPTNMRTVRISSKARRNRASSSPLASPMFSSSC